ncbi:hypothetical protein CEAn_00051 [Coxiella endosymbiont of Amblyomma nuttalli]|nr:hypothetical protein CEAn_00051 [Coxiella endosymbiont of Amblyomma nuttalli]
MISACLPHAYLPHAYSANLKPPRFGCGKISSVLAFQVINYLNPMKNICQRFAIVQYVIAQCIFNMIAMCFQDISAGKCLFRSANKSLT